MPKQKNPIRSVVSAQVRYTSEGRSGTVHYESPEACFNMWYEFAGGNAVAIIDIPTPEFWPSRTQLPLSQRDQVLHFIGNQVVNDQAPGGYFTVDDNTLTIYTGRK